MTDDISRNTVARRPCLVVDPAGSREEPLPMVCEASVKIYLDGELFTTSRAMAADLEDLAVGHLVACGALKSFDELVDVNTDANRRKVDVKSTIPSDRRSLGRHEGAPVSSSLQIAAAVAIRMGCDFNQRPGLYATTRCVHSAGFSDGSDIFCIREDVGRHNAVDKAIGAAFRAGHDLSGLFLLCSGRLPSDMVSKLAGAGVPLVISPAAATCDGAALAEESGITICGRVARDRMIVYSCTRRVTGLT